MAFPARPRVIPPELIVEWKAKQAELRRRLVVEPLSPMPRFIAGADAAFLETPKRVVAVALVWDRKLQRVVDLVHVHQPLTVPYVPTFLSFREGPAVMEAVGRLTHPFGVICFDGQGYAHPRRCGLASHVGITLDLPSIGCAKSRLIGEHKEPADADGATAKLMHEGEQIGVVLRPLAGARPIYVSIGHRVDLRSTIRVVRACCTRYRIPEPTRIADIEVAKAKKAVGGKQ